MNKKEFFEEFKELCEYFNNGTYKNKKLTRMYYEKCKNMNIEEFKKLCEELMYKLKFMPKIADFDRKNGYSTLEGRIYTKEFLESLYDIGGN